MNEWKNKQMNEQMNELSFSPAETHEHSDCFFLTMQQLWKHYTLSNTRHPAVSWALKDQTKRPRIELWSLHDP